MTSRGTYTVHEQLGVGGMASVHRAERRTGTTRQFVALKRLLPGIASDPQLVDLFLHEARVASRLRHRNICQIYEAGQLDDDYFIAMEYVAGPTLNQLMRTVRETVGQVPFPIVIKVLSEVCEALAYAHTCRDDHGRPLGLVHRDVSPSNIVISSNGVVKLIDFGVAKTVTSQTQAGVIKGKLGYVAPEYLEGSIDARADLWAVGVCAWEMLTGQRLFKSDDDFSTLMLVKSQPIDPPSIHNADVPPELDSIVMTALHREPRERWQNADALRTALLGVAKPSSHAELVEWVDWVMKLNERGARPPRGSRPLPMSRAKAQCIQLPIAAQTIAIASPQEQPIVTLPASAPTVVAHVPQSVKLAIEAAAEAAVDAPMFVTPASAPLAQRARGEHVSLTPVPVPVPLPPTPPLAARSPSPAVADPLLARNQVARSGSISSSSNASTNASTKPRSASTATSASTTPSAPRYSTTKASTTPAAPAVRSTSPSSRNASFETSTSTAPAARTTSPSSRNASFETSTSTAPAARSTSPSSRNTSFETSASTTPAAPAARDATSSSRNGSPPPRNAAPPPVPPADRTTARRASPPAPPRPSHSALMRIPSTKPPTPGRGSRVRAQSIREPAFASEPTTDPFAREVSGECGDATFPFVREAPEVPMPPPSQGIIRAKGSAENATVAERRRAISPPVSSPAVTAFSSGKVFPPAPSRALPLGHLLIGILLSLTAAAIVVASMLAV